MGVVSNIQSCIIIIITVLRVLTLCDWVRDEVLVDLGDRLEDKTGLTRY